MTYISVNHMAQALHLAFDVDIIASLYDKPTLVIDTSFGSTVGVVGHAPLYEADSRSHVELLQPHIASVVEEAGLKPADIQRVVVGTGPAPFTGLRAGIVAARAFALATGAQLVGMNVLETQSTWNRLEIANMGQYYTDSAYPNSAYPNSAAAQTYHFTLAVNDARRKQLYYALYGQGGEEILAMNIASATDIAQGVREVLRKFGFVQGDSARSVDTAGVDGFGADSASGLSDGASSVAGAGGSYVVDIIGHGATRYESAWADLPVGEVREESVLHDAGAAGLAIFASCALMREFQGKDVSTDPLYLRRPDVTIPAPNKHILGQTSISLRVGGQVENHAQIQNPEKQNVKTQVGGQVGDSGERKG